MGLLNFFVGWFNGILRMGLEWSSWSGLMTGLLLWEIVTPIISCLILGGITPHNNSLFLLRIESSWLFNDPSRGPFSLLFHCSSGSNLSRKILLWWWFCGGGFFVGIVPKPGLQLKQK